MNHIENMINLAQTGSNLDECLAVVDQINKLFEGNELGSTLQKVSQTLKDTEYALIGGLAAGFFSNPRATEDIDLLIMNEDLEKIAQILILNGFKRTRVHAVVDRTSGVEVELLTAKFLNIPEEIVGKILKNTLEQKGTKLAQVEGLVAMKLLGGRYKDLGDIEEILKVQPDLKIDEYEEFLTLVQINMFAQLKADIHSHDLQDLQ